MYTWKVNIVKIYVHLHKLEISSLDLDSISVLFSSSSVITSMLHEGLAKGLPFVNFSPYNFVINDDMLYTTMSWQAWKEHSHYHQLYII